VPRTFRDWIEHAERRFRSARLFFGHGTHNAHDEAVWLLVHVAGIGFDEVDAVWDRALDDRQARRAARLIDARIATRKPLAYLLREAWLMGEKFYVDERVIVPRSFIAELLPHKLRPWLARSPRRVLDLCTGSGCLGILAARAYPKAAVDASDISAAALQVARRNVTDHRLRSRVRLVKSDLFDSLAGRRYDLIITNPPYVDARSMKRLPKEYTHEPALALAAGSDGLDAVRRILARAPEFMKSRGVLVVETGHRRETVERSFKRLPLTWITTSAGDGVVFLATKEELGGLHAP
jgi:ribosomal protein L3 glutamine methyltransferase